MTSHRKRKKQARARGLSVPGLELVELLEEVLESLRWLQVLGYGNQYLMEKRLDIDQADRDKILEAATRVVDKDARLKNWRERLARIRSRLEQLEGSLEGVGEGVVPPPPEDPPPGDPPPGQESAGEA